MHSSGCPEPSLTATPASCLSLLVGNGMVAPAGGLGPGKFSHCLTRRLWRGVSSSSPAPPTAPVHWNGCSHFPRVHLPSQQPGGVAHSYGRWLQAMSGLWAVAGRGIPLKTARPWRPPKCALGFSAWLEGESSETTGQASRGSRPPRRKLAPSFCG